MTRTRSFPGAAWLAALLVLATCSGDAETRLTVGDRTVLVRGGGSHAVTTLDDGFDIEVDGRTFRLTADALLISGGSSIALPEWGTIEVRLDDGALIVLADGEDVGRVPFGRGETGDDGDLPGPFVPVEVESGWAARGRLEDAGGSASRAASLAFDRLDGFFDDRPEPVAGFRDAEDGLAQALFRARREGRDVFGALVVTVGDGDAWVGLVWDEATRAPRSIGPGLETLGAVRGPAPGDRDRVEPPIEWVERPLPDGSGRIRIPSDWRVTGASQGAVDVRGPDGELLSLGIGVPIFLPEATISPLTGRPQPGVVAAPWTDPPTALATLVPQISAVGRMADPHAPAMDFQRIVESAPLPSAVGGRAAFVLWDLGFEGRPFRALTYVDMGPPSGGVWMFYTSTAAAPVERFQRALPVLLEAWQRGWTIDPAVFQRRLEGALATMRETHEIWRGANAARQRAQDDAAADFSEAFRGSRTVRDLATGEEADADIGWVDETVQRMNERAGWERYEAVPLREWLRE